ncbi:MAG: HDIG domain-containing protein [Acetobacteraceae bacterium]|nr:HDIG domain-containing protein [Acetobacteraceae bacterium]
MTREEALAAVKRNLKNPNLLKHTLAVEAVMRRLAGRLGQDPERWGLAGLLHDIDYSLTFEDPERHSQVGADMLAEMGLDAELVEAVRAHNDRHGLPRTTDMARALYAADPLTGLIVAAALIHPQKRLAPLDPAFVLNRFKEKSFARGARRDAIESCSELGLGLEEFVALGLEAMQGVAAELGL